MQPSSTLSLSCKEWKVLSQRLGNLLQAVRNSITLGLRHLKIDTVFFDPGASKSINFYYVLALQKGRYISISILSYINKIYIPLIKATTQPPPKKYMERLFFNKILPILQIIRSVETRCPSYQQSIIKHIMGFHVFHSSRPLKYKPVYVDSMAWIKGVFYPVGSETLVCLPCP